MSGDHIRTQTQTQTINVMLCYLLWVLLSKLHLELIMYSQDFLIVAYAGCCAHSTHGVYKKQETGGMWHSSGRPLEK